MELIHFIFSGPWIFIGFVVLVYVVLDFVVGIAKAIRGPIGRCSQCLGPYVKQRQELEEGDE